MNILMVAAENGALPGGKVGGMGDVLRDVPRALAALGHRVTVLTPAYGAFHEAPKVRSRGTLTVDFRRGREEVALHTLPAAGPQRRVQTFLVEHPLFATCGRGRIYCDDPPDEPFASDSAKFALFSAAAATGLRDGWFGEQHVVHLHDWHTATVAVLARLHPAFAALRRCHLVFSIHNLAMQGIRPLHGHPASLLAWFPELPVAPALIDPRHGDCYNPMRAAVALCDRIHAVSPTYAEEICDPASTFGEGLHVDLSAARSEHRLHGILNGCEYPAKMPRALSRTNFLQLARSQLTRWIGSERHVRSAHVLALDGIDRELHGGRARSCRLLTFVGRLTEQKFGLLARRLGDGRPAIAYVLDALADDEQLVVLGSGDPALEQLLTTFQASHPSRLLFLCGYSEALSDQLYASGDLFLMPSRFEPCGIAQMLAMRAGQPCLVNRTGGLADTVRDEEDGFVFDGDTDSSRTNALLERLAAALDCLRNDPGRYGSIRDKARRARFPWKGSARAYVDRLYDIRDA
jgi:starch synthase